MDYLSRIEQVDETRPEPMDHEIDKNKIRQITIEELTRGFVIKVGCSTFAFSTKDELVEKLIQYIKEPNETEKKYRKGELF